MGRFRMRNPIGFHSVALHRYPIERVIEKVAAAGYDAVELNAETLPWAPPHVTPELPDDIRDRIRKKAREAGILISSVSAHRNMVSVDPIRRKIHLRYIRGCIDLAADTGTDIVHLLSGAPPETVSRQEAMNWLSDGIAQCIAYGEDRGVHIALEPVATHLICDSAGMLALMDAVRPLHLFVNLDPSHLWVHGDDVPAAIRTFGDRIVHVHVKDAAGRPDNFRFPPLGRGDGDFKRFFHALKDIGYHGVMSVEYEAGAFGYRQTEKEILKGSLQFVRPFLAPDL